MMMMNKTKKGLCVVITATWLSLFALAPVATTAAAAVTSLRGPNESSDVNTVVDGKSEEASQQPRRDLMNYAHNNHGNYIQYTGNTYYPPLAHEPLRRPMNVYERNTEAFRLHRHRHQTLPHAQQQQIPVIYGSVHRGPGMYLFRDRHPERNFRDRGQSRQCLSLPCDRHEQ